MRVQFYTVSKCLAPTAHIDKNVPCRRTPVVGNLVLHTPRNAFLDVLPFLLLVSLTFSLAILDEPQCGQYVFHLLLPNDCIDLLDRKYIAPRNGTAQKTPYPEILGVAIVQHMHDR